jgi:hypothetical protein
VKRWPGAKITLRNGARIIEKTWPVVYGGLITSGESEPRLDPVRSGLSYSQGAHRRP